MMRPSSVVDEMTAMQNGRQRCHELSAELLEKINPLSPTKCDGDMEDIV